MSELRQQIPSRLLGYLPLFLLFAGSLLLYLPSLHHNFVFDDTWLVTGNPYITSWKYLPQMLSKDSWNIWDPHNYWRPVFSISLALDYSLWGLNPFGFHLTNVLLHAINAALLFSLGKRLQNTTCAAFASLLFALHPIQAHAVNVISIRGDLLAVFFTLLSLHAFFSRRTIPLAIALVFALLSKETSMFFPLGLLFAGIIISKDKRDWKPILAFAILGVYLVARLFLGFSFDLPRGIFSYQVSWEIRLLLAFKVLALYFLALLNLFEMPHPFWTVEIPASVGDPYVIAGILIFGLLLGAIWKSLKNNPLIAFGLAWFLVFFLPISNLKELNQPMMEHWLYIPLMGLCLAFGAVLNALSIRLPKARLLRAGVTAGVFMFLVFAALVVREKTKIYRDNESFLLAGIRANPRIPRLYSFLGGIYLAKQDIPKAKEFYTKALILDPGEFSANYMLGILLHQTGQREEARIYLERIARISPRLKWDFYPVAHAWEMLGDKPKALFYYRKALDTYPDSVEIKQKIATLEETMPLSQR